MLSFDGFIALAFGLSTLFLQYLMYRQVLAQRRPEGRQEQRQRERRRAKAGAPQQRQPKHFAWLRSNWSLLWPLLVMTLLVALAWIPFLFLRDRSPKAHVDVVELTPRVPFLEPGEPTAFDIYIGNLGDEIARDLTWATEVKLLRRDPTKALLNDILEEFKVEDDRGEPKDLGFTQPFRYSIQTHELSESEVREIFEGPLELYVLSHVTYRDSNGQHEGEFCRRMLKPEPTSPIGFRVCRNTLR